MSRPDKRFYEISHKLESSDDLVKDILAKGKSYPIYEQCLILKKSRLKACYIEASLLSSNDFAKISDLLEIPEEVIRIYSLVFFDVSNFDVLSKMELLEVKDAEERMLKMWALSQGLDFIAWRLGKQVNINPTSGLNDLFTMCVYKAKEAAFSGNASKASVEASKWTKLSLDFARLLKAWVVDSNEARADIELALSEVLPEFTSLADLQGNY